MTSRKKDKVKTAEAPPISAIEAPEIASESKLDITPETAPKAAKNAAGVQDTDEKPAAGFPIVGIGASAGGLAVFEVEDGMTVQLG